MRSAFAALGLVSLSAAVVGCTTEDGVPAYVSVEYQLRCLDDCVGSADSAPRRIYHLNSEDGFRVYCRVGTNTSGGKQLEFEAYCDGEGACGSTRYGLELSGIDPTREDGDPGNRCSIAFREGENTYETACRSGGVSNNQRCEVTTKIDAENSLVRGTLRCDAIPDPDAPTITRDVVEPGGEVDAETHFIVQGCEGL